MTPRVGPSSVPSTGPRRPSGEAGGEGPRREISRGSARPLPNVAAPTNPLPRGGGSQRSAPAAPLPKTQRPEKSVTREEMLALMKSGQLNAFPPPGGHGGPGAGPRGGQPQRGAGPAPGQPRSGPTLGAGSIARRPAAGPGSVAPAAPPITTEEEDDKKGKTGRLPTVLFNHSHGGGYKIGKTEFIEGREYLANPPYAEFLTSLGYNALCFDAWIFGERSNRRTKVKKSRDKARAFVEDLRELRTGDYVVHMEHGIGRYLV